MRECSVKYSACDATRAARAMFDALHARKSMREDERRRAVRAARRAGARATRPRVCRCE